MLIFQKKLENYIFYVKVKENLTKMITIEQVLKKRTDFIKSNLNKYLVDKNQVLEYSKPLWFKGSRYR